MRHCAKTTTYHQLHARARACFTQVHPTLGHLGHCAAHVVAMESWSNVHVYGGRVERSICWHALHTHAARQHIIHVLNTCIIPSTARWRVWPYPSASLNSDSSPAARMISWPSIAGFLLPDTGASRKRPPLEATASPIRLDVVSSTVDMSTYPLLLHMASSTPDSPNTTFHVMH